MLMTVLLSSSPVLTINEFFVVLVRLVNFMSKLLNVY
jgi:hypothetical protein